jgi:cystathionine beta-lyase/cystathionine gamma-synthase
MRFSTKAVHAGEDPDDVTGSVVVPIYQTSTFRQRELGVEGKYVYSRTGNPTRGALERAVAELEEGKYGLAFASGMATITTVMLGILHKGDHVVAVQDLYGGTRRLFERIMLNFGVRFSYVEGTNPNDFSSALTPETKMIWVETPTNPLLKIVDIQGTSRVARDTGAIVVVDNTFMSPYLQQPLKLGADIVIHSATKYLGGHSDLVGGVAVTSNEGLFGKVHFAQNAAGAVPGPFDSWLALRGLRTLALRMDRHCSNAQKIAEFLAGHEKVSQVLYPGLNSHPQHAQARAQMRAFGGMISFHVKGGFELCKSLLKHLKVFTVAESLGGVESLIEHPASMTHASVPREQREKIGVTDSLIRLSVGIEDAEDLIFDLSAALSQI